MPFDVFRLREHVVREYRDYVESFVHVLDPRIDEFVRARLAEGELWPEAVLQLNPAYEPGPTLGELTESRAILAGTARFFGTGLRLHRHQTEALAAAGRGDNYIVSTGTGSGKSLTYLVPIFDMILRDDPARHSVRALIVYPMNALINSQVGALSAFRAANWPACPVRFAQYTGQTREEVRQQLLQDPPHIQLRDARVHADPAAGAGAGRRDATGVALPVRRRAACLSRPPRGGCGDAATSPAPANGATQPTICRYIGDNRDRRRSCDPTRADRRGRKPLVRCPGSPRRM